MNNSQIDLLETLLETLTGKERLAFLGWLIASACEFNLEFFNNSNNKVSTELNNAILTAGNNTQSNIRLQFAISHLYFINFNTGVSQDKNLNLKLKND